MLLRQMVLYGLGVINNVGRLGDGTTVNKSSPVQIGSLTDWDSIIKFSTSGSSSVEAIKTDNTLWKWGAGSIVDDAKVLSPVLIGSNYTKLSGGAAHTIAINADGELWAWGLNRFGELGTGEVYTSSSPVQVGSLTDWDHVSSGSNHTHAIKTDGTLWAWGRNIFYGMLGDGTTVNKSSPVQIGSLTDWALLSKNSGTASFRCYQNRWYSMDLGL
jgi:alpha-tubulin suppressor-like RCC1 family protein